MELLDLSNHHSHRRVPHHFKHISSQGFWMILIGRRTDGYWKPGGCLSPIFLALQKGDLRCIFDVFSTRPPLPCKPRPTRPTLPKIMTLTLTPHSCRTQLYHHLATVGSVDWKLTHPDRYYNLLITWLISERRSQETETRFDGSALEGERSVKFLIHWLPDRSINRETETTIDGHKTIVSGTGHVYFKSQTSIFTYVLINQSIDWYINGQKKRTEGQISSTKDSSTHWQDRHKIHINRTDGRSNRHNRILKIPAITIPTIPDINIPFHQ